MRRTYIMSNEQTVQDIYAAFQRGDVPAILERLADDVQWEAWDNHSAHAANVPWMRPRQGKAGAAEFFATVGQMLITDFRVLSIMSGSNQVAAELIVGANVPGGGHFRDEEMHLWTFDASGKVTRLRHYIDTTKHIDAARNWV
jgi:ketosteroid isomerase-like protein